MRKNTGMAWCLRVIFACSLLCAGAAAADPMAAPPSTDPSSPPPTPAAARFLYRDHGDQRVVAVIAAEVAGPHDQPVLRILIRAEAPEIEPPIGWSHPHGGNRTTAHDLARLTSAGQLLLHTRAASSAGVSPCLVQRTAMEQRLMAADGTLRQERSGVPLVTAVGFELPLHTAQTSDLALRAMDSERLRIQVTPQPEGTWHIAISDPHGGTP